VEQEDVLIADNYPQKNVDLVICDDLEIVKSQLEQEGKEVVIYHF
jgi:hypothetical protein